MAACRVCGEKAGMLREICSECESKELAAKLAESERMAAENAAVFKQEVKLKLNQWNARTKDRLASGGKSFAYQWVYLQVDSVITDDVIGTWDIASLQALGLSGWEIVSVVPRTVGIGLTNVSYGTSHGETWGAGVGGNVAGVYVLLSKACSGLDGEDGEILTSMANDLLNSGYELN